MKVLVIAPHPDDETIGCGGTLCNHSKRGDSLSLLFLTSGELGLKQHPCEKAWQIREAEARRAAKVLGARQLDFLRLPDWNVSGHFKKGAHHICAILAREKPHLIYLPHPLESHPDHRVVLKLVRAALHHYDSPAPELRGYEVWTPIVDYSHVENITAEMGRKCRALRCHRSQLKTFAYDRAVRGLNQFRGELAGRCRYAEVFQELSAGSR